MRSIDLLYYLEQLNKKGGSNILLDMKGETDPARTTNIASVNLAMLNPAESMFERLLPVQDRGEVVCKSCRRHPDPYYRIYNDRYCLNPEVCYGSLQVKDLSLVKLIDSIADHHGYSTEDALAIEGGFDIIYILLRQGFRVVLSFRDWIGVYIEHPVFQKEVSSRLISKCYECGLEWIDYNENFRNVLQLRVRDEEYSHIAVYDENKKYAFTHWMCRWNNLVMNFSKVSENLPASLPKLLMAGYTVNKKKEVANG